MKRILIGIALLGVIATSITASAQPSKHHVTRPAAAMVTAEAHGGCPAGDPSSCPPGCGGHGSANAAMSAPLAKPAMATHAACNGQDPAKCPASCRAAAAGTTAERVASR